MAFFSMSLAFLFSALSFQCSSCSYSSSTSSLSIGSSLSVEKPAEDIINSANQMFSAGFFKIGENAYTFSVWFKDPRSPTTVVWMANRDQPVNGKRSKLILLPTGNVILTDAGQYIVWSSNTASNVAVQLHLKDDGNLVLRERQKEEHILWQSFDFPTDTLLAGQHLTRYTQLVSARSETNHSSGFYKLFFDNDNVLRLLYDGPQVSSTYWPNPWEISWVSKRSTYNSSRVAVLNYFGEFISSDNYTFQTFDYGVILQRRLTVDCDGNVRVYSRKDASQKWEVSWQAIEDSCTIHGICGANSTCQYDHKYGRKCSCLPGYKMKNHSDWSYGCEPKLHLTCNENESTFLELPNVELYGYDIFYIPNISYHQCEKLCLEDCQCKGFQFEDRTCYTKDQLLNGRRSPGVRKITYLRVPKSHNFSSLEGESIRAYDQKCNAQEIHRDYVKRHESPFVRFFLWFATAIGGLEIFCILVVLVFLNRTRQRFQQGYQYHIAGVGFRKFSYSEIEEATKGFTQEIGRGSGGVVYKGILSDQRIAAIKRLNNEGDKQEGEFLAEVSIIGRLNHMNMIDMWGYCAEGKHRLLVCEYMENGSLAENLSSNALDWSNRYNIALGTARVLAYLHEECLEWILHCDIKPQNILLDSNYQPKLADFGLSKLLNRNKKQTNNSTFSMIRGTRGYMAPEWIFNLPITSKVDVYSYGIVLLEMITGKSPTIMDIETVDGEGSLCTGRLVTWVRKKKRTSSCWVEQIIDPAIGPNYDGSKMEMLTRVALDCVEDDRDARPTMSQVVEMLQSHESDPQ